MLAEHAENPEEAFAAEWTELVLSGQGMPQHAGEAVLGNTGKANVPDGPEGSGKSGRSGKNR